MSNFSFLTVKTEYTLFAPACIEAEKIYASTPAMCAVGCRKALELAIKWVYAVDKTIQMPYKNNLQSLIQEQSFYDAMDKTTWQKLPFIVKLGNLAVHTEQNVQRSDALTSLKNLFEFVQWIDYCYGSNYEERTFEESQIPAKKVVVDIQKVKEQQALLNQKEEEIEQLRKQIEALSAICITQKEHRQSRTFHPEKISEFKTRKIYIDVDMKLIGWKFAGVDADVQEEYRVEDMAGVEGQVGYCDYVLFGKDGLPLAVVEAKRTSEDPTKGRTQAFLYAECLERKFGRWPMIFTTNGFETKFKYDRNSSERPVSGIFGKDDLQKLMNRRSSRLDLMSIPIDDKITNRYYQKAAIRKVCEGIQKECQKHLLVMATGTGKTRTAASLTDVLSRGHWVTNVLFLADRKALVRQAKDNFKDYLPNMSLCNLCVNKDDRNARIVFSTYPTILNAIDDTKSEEGRKLFTPAHFDLIIIDESHRSIFKKYRAIFDYFDAILVGLTATPKTEVDHDTYKFFGLKQNDPTYLYEYDTAVYQDHVLVPYYNYSVKTKFLEDGIKYNELSTEDKQRYEEDFTEDDYLPEHIPPEKLNKFVFNETTVDIVLQDVMERGIHVAGGDRLGKTIIFAQSKSHAEFILQRFNKLYPNQGCFAQRVICDDAYAQTVIDNFKQPEKEPHIAVSVDMMDTGIDVRECVNLVFFKKVYSKTKFWQMIGRGTRLCEELNCVDQIDGEYTGKRRFLIFDYCGNFEYFQQNKEGYEAKQTKTLSEDIFGKQIRIIMALQESVFVGDDYQAWRNKLVNDCHKQITDLVPDRISVKLKRRYVEKYKQIDAFLALSKSDKDELLKQIAPLVNFSESDEFAKRFDNFMYGLILAYIEQRPNFKQAKKQLCDTASLLQKKITVPQIKEKLPLLQQIHQESFWNANDVLLLEKVRQELRGLIQFLNDSDKKKNQIITRLADSIVEQKEGVVLEAAYNFDDYRAKVNSYINEHNDTIAIYKLTHNIPLSMGDYQELERVLTSELGNKEDYEREFGNAPFGLLVRKIAKLNHEAAMQAFSDFINDQSLNAKQISFVNKIINHIELNGYMENISELTKPPFDKPVNFLKLFDTNTQTALIKTINQVRENAVQIVAS